MKTKYVCRGLISLYVNFHNNWTMWSLNLHVKICRWGERKKSLKRMTQKTVVNCSFEEKRALFQFPLSPVFKIL